MTVATPIKTKSRSKAKKPRYAGKMLSLEAFFRWQPEDNEPFKYEWDNGFIISEATFMKNTERGITAYMLDVFDRTQAKREGGKLLSETEILLSSLNKVRRPDVAFFTKAEIEQSTKGEQPMPQFIVEVVSDYDRFSYYEDKLEEYFLSGVGVVWLVVPYKRKVYVFTSIRNVKICLDDDVCSAAPAIADFTLTPDQLFAEPALT
jgi:Uma2 family endonuclease